MSIKEQLQLKIESMSQADLEWLQQMLEQQEYPDLRVERSAEKTERMIQAARELGESTDMDMMEFNQAVQRRSWSAR